MATVTVDVTKMITKLDFLTQAVADEAEIMINQAAKIGADTAKRTLEQAVTKYGTERYARGQGNGPGRDDTGSMIDSLQALPPKVTKGKIEVAFGWGRGKTKKYYKFQEYGTAKIKAALSLFAGRTAILNELPRLENNMKQRIRGKMK